MRALMAAVAVVGLLGCGPVQPGYAQPSVRDRLDVERVTFRVLPSSAAGALWAMSAEVPLALPDGRLEAQAGVGPSGSVLSVRSTELLLGVVTVPASAGCLGLTLADLQLRLTAPVDLPLRWYGDGAVGFATGSAQFTLTGQQVVGDGVAWLEPTPVEATLSVEAVEQGSAVALEVVVARPGAVLTAGGMGLRDLELGFRALEVAPAD